MKLAILASDLRKYSADGRLCLPARDAFLRLAHRLETEGLDELAEAKGRADRLDAARDELARRQAEADRERSDYRDRIAGQARVNGQIRAALAEVAAGMTELGKVAGRIGAGTDGVATHADGRASTMRGLSVYHFAGEGSADAGA